MLDCFGPDFDSRVCLDCGHYSQFHPGNGPVWPCTVPGCRCYDVALANPGATMEMQVEETPCNPSGHLAAASPDAAPGGFPISEVDDGSLDFWDTYDHDYVPLPKVYEACHVCGAQPMTFVHYCHKPRLTYVCGPMSGMPEFNHPAFHAMAKKLRDKGVEVLNPAELDTDTDQPWAFYLRRDLEYVAREVNRIVLLPGYERSKGARLELHVGQELGMEIIYPGQFELWYASLPPVCPSADSDVQTPTDNQEGAQRVS